MHECHIYKHGYTNMVNTNMVNTNMGTNMGSKIRRHEHGVKEPIMG